MGPREDEDILSFDDAAQFERWLAEHHAERDSLWLLIAKKASGLASVTPSEAIDVALCFGWIDGQRRSHDGTHFLQRYSRRRPRSAWSQVNVDRVAALTAAGRMRPAGLTQVAAAQADGRWDAAYEAQRSATVPTDLAAALADDEAARRSFAALGRTDRYRVFLPLLKARTDRERAARRDRIVADLAAAAPVR